MNPKQAKTKADILFSKLIREHGTCQAQGYGPRDCTPRLECAHWISRRYSWTRTDPDNAFCLCSSHHRWFTDHPTEWGRWATKQRGDATYQRLLKTSQQTGKFDWVEELANLTYLADSGLFGQRTPCEHGETREHWMVGVVGKCPGGTTIRTT